MSTATINPRKGASYTDRIVNGRVLVVDQINAGSPLGREVIGRVFGPREPVIEGGGQPYSTSFQIFAAIWTRELSADG